jgi:hypothetical protein
LEIASGLLRVPVTDSHRIRKNGGVWNDDLPSFFRLHGCRSRLYIRNIPLNADDKSVDPVVQLRLREMLDFVERISRWYDQMIALPRSTIATLMKLGGGVARLLDRGKRSNRDLS